MKITFPLLICVLLGQLPASAQTVHYITNLFDSGAGSFRSEVGLALPGDTIRFQVTGTITLINGAIVYDKDLVIDGPGMDQLTISGGGQSGVLIVQGHSSWISGLSLVDGQITGNLSNGGAGLFFTGDTLVLDSVRIADCTNSSGGGTIYGGGARIEALRVRMTDCVVENNLLHSAGGSGIAVGPQGGGAYIVADSVRMVHSAFLLNRCWQTNSFAGSVIAEGGGFTLDGAAQLIGCTIDGNTVEARCYYDPVYFAVSTGGGIDAEHNSYLELIDCSVSHNTLVARADVDWQETGKGAGVSADRTYMHLSGCTITGNVMEEAVVGNGELLGGGFYLYNSPLLLEHCVVDSNVCNNGSAIYADGGSPTTDPRPLDISHSRFSANSGKAAEHVIRSNARDRLQLIDVELSGNLHNSLIALADTNRIIGCLFAENRGQVYFSNDGTNENLIMNTTFTRSSPTLPALRVVNTNLTMINCTMVDDSLTGPGARELSLDNSVVQMKNTILAETFFHGSSAFGQTGGAVISLGGNVCVDGSLAAYLNQPTDANNTQPGMGTFADHGGYSRTWSLLPSSTCIDRGGPDTLTMDQRGFLRDADSDAGAFEFGAADPTIAIVSISPDQVVCEGGSLELSVTANSGVSLDHQWYLNGVAIPGATSATYSTAAVQADSGAYTCSVWNALDSTVVGPVMVQVEVCAGLNVHASDGLRIHPNPTDDASGLFIEFPAKAGVQQVTVLDAQGRLIKQLVVTGAERVHVPLYGSAPGAYTLHVRFHDGVLHRRFIVR